MVPATTMSTDRATRQRRLPSVRLRPRLVSVTSDPRVDLGARLSRQCLEMAGRLTRARAITLNCDATRERLERATATQLALISEELVASAFNAFERHQGGRIDVLFEVGELAMTLTVEHSRPSPRAASCHSVAHSWLARNLVARLGGRLQNAIVIGGARTVVTVPRA